MTKFIQVNNYIINISQIVLIECQLDNETLESMLRVSLSSGQKIDIRSTDKGYFALFNEIKALLS